MKPRYWKLDTGTKIEHFRTVTTHDNKVVLFNKSTPKTILMGLMNTYSAHRYSRVRTGVNAGKIYIWEYHCKDGPAYTDIVTGVVEFYVYGIRHTDTKRYSSACGLSDQDAALMILKYGHRLPFFIDGRY